MADGNTQHDGFLALVHIIKTSNDLKECQYAYGKIVYTLGLEILVRFADVAIGANPEGGNELKAEKATLAASGGGGGVPKVPAGRPAPGPGPHTNIVVSTANNALTLGTGEDTNSGGHH